MGIHEHVGNVAAGTGCLSVLLALSRLSLCVKGFYEKVQQPVYGDVYLTETKGQEPVLSAFPIPCSFYYPDRQCGRTVDDLWLTLLPARLI